MRDQKHLKIYKKPKKSSIVPKKKQKNLYITEKTKNSKKV